VVDQEYLAMNQPIENRMANRPYFLESNGTFLSTISCSLAVFLTSFCHL
jgi:hypothetical protein